jgi:hypothetical protein
MRQAKVVIDVRERQLVVSALFAFAERNHAPSDRGHMLADGEVGALDEGGIDLPARSGQHLLDVSQGAEHHAMVHANQASAAVRFDHLGL